METSLHITVVIADVGNIDVGNNDWSKGLNCTVPLLKFVLYSPFNRETEDDINRSSNDILDDDPTPQSLAIHSMTQGDDEEDDLSGNDPDVSQFVTSGMEVDTPVKFEMGETSMRHRLLEHQIILHQVTYRYLISGTICLP